MRSEGLAFPAWQILKRDQIRNRLFTLELGKLAAFFDKRYGHYADLENGACR